MSTFDSHAYLANLFLHCVILSFVAVAIAATFRNPHARSQAAVLGLLAASIVPWFSAIYVPKKETVVPIQASSIRHESSERTDFPITETLPYQPSETVGPSQVSRPIRLPSVWTLVSKVWATGFLAMLVTRIISLLRFSRWNSTLRRATPAEREFLRENSDSQFESRRVLISAAGSSPCVKGVFAPCLVVPENLLSGDRLRELKWALRHETGHLRSQDLQWSAFFQLLLAPLWWNPAVWCLVRIWSDSREKICDNLAIGSQEERAEYASFLVSLGTRRIHGSGLAMASRGKVSRLKNRLVFLMENRPCEPCGMRLRAGLTIALILAGFGISRLGVSAQTPIESKPQATEETVSEITPPVQKTPAPEAAVLKPPFKVGHIKFTTRLLQTSEPFAENGKVITAEELQTLMRKLAQTPDAELMTVPSATCRSGQNCMIEVIWEKPKDQPTSRKSGQGFDDPSFAFIGIMVRFNGQIAEDGITTDFKIALGQQAGTTLKQIGETNSHKVDWDKVRRIDAGMRKKIVPKNSMCVTIGEIDPGHHLTAIVTASLVDGEGHHIDKNGQRIEASEITIPGQVSVKQKPLPPLPPFKLFASGKVVLVEKPVADKIITVNSTSPPCLILPNSEELDEAIRNVPVADLTELPRREIGKATDPLEVWKEFPSFRLNYSYPKPASVAGFWWEYSPDQHGGDAVRGSLGLVGSQLICIELPSQDPGQRRLLILGVEMVKD